MFSRLKVSNFQGFNTQPPEGGWQRQKFHTPQNLGFNTQPPEGGWNKIGYNAGIYGWFQHTAARRRLETTIIFVRCEALFQHTAARRRLVVLMTSRRSQQRSFNTQPPEGGWAYLLFNRALMGFQHTAARRRLDRYLFSTCTHIEFQHTAARRRLAARVQQRRRLYYCFNTQPPEGGWILSLCPTSQPTVSTHSRPKAAGFYTPSILQVIPCFNTQPPEGGWVYNSTHG